MRETHVVSMSESSGSMSDVSTAGSANATISAFSARTLSRFCCCKAALSSSLLDAALAELLLLLLSSGAGWRKNNLAWVSVNDVGARRG